MVVRKKSGSGTSERIQIGQFKKEDPGHALVMFLRKQNIDIARTLVDQSLQEAVAEVREQMKKMPKQA